MPGGQGGPRFSGFGVGRGFAIWRPFPVQAPDNAPETWTWSTRSEGGRQLARPQPRRKPDRLEVPSICWTCCRWSRLARADRDSQVSALGVGLPSGGPFPVRAPDSAPETWTWSTRSKGGRQLARPQPRRKPDRVEVPNMRWTCCRWCRVARADRDSQVSALGVGLPSGGPFPVRAPDSAPETWTWSTRSEGGRQLAGPQPRRKPVRVEVPSMCWTCGSLVS